MINAFKEYLLLRGSVKSTYVPFYLKWVSACYELLDLDPSSRLTIDQKKQFLAHMTKRYEDWQVKQADTALRLYDYFLSREGRKSERNGDKNRDEWKSLEEKMHEALRLRQRSYSTEKTYLIWVRSFRSFAGKKQPAELKGRDLQDFLSYLSVNGVRHD